ncbi:hypothetical protein LSM04_000310 [Trypanosoma melophagium]|uniref:uncharacterized protein n=1 Tax=Trypanosoma melophagium TaxID=715481 RepID=UPI00351AACF0|nr:hypothetical protein LSM04_000310 [Trypanosoma melophagium]
MPSIECGKQSPGVISKKGQKIPMCSFVTKYRRRVETYAAQNAQDIGFLSPTVGLRVRTEEIHSINNDGGRFFFFFSSLVGSMPAHIKCAPQCEE